MKDFLTFSEQWRPTLEQSIRKHVAQFCDEVLVGAPRMGVAWQALLSEKLVNYACGGKLIRGMLAVYWGRLYGCEEGLESSLFSLGAALELLQTFLLIHDDIMDGDAVRRGMPSMHVQLAHAVQDYTVDSRQELCADYDFARMGEALGICLGDMVFSHAVGVIGEVMPTTHVKRAVQIFTAYVSKVGLAQMNDMYWECSAVPPTKDAILAMYEGKTGHYTFTLPALMGYVYALASQGRPVDDGEVAHLARAGGLMGQVFQICDDVLDIRYATSVTGKPRGSDFMQKKRTFFQWKLFECATKHGMLVELHALCEGTIGEVEVEKVCAWAEAWKVYDEIQEEYEVLLRELDECFEALVISAEAKDHMRNFVQYLIIRRA